MFLAAVIPVTCSLAQPPPGPPSNAVPAFVIPAPPFLTRCLHLTNHSFRFTVTNVVPGSTNVIQASTNVLDWVNIYTNVPPISGYVYTDTNATSSRRFYRVEVVEH